MTTLDLREEWTDLLRRRPSFASTLTICGSILDGWASWSPARVVALTWGPGDCVRRWQRGIPLIAEAPPPVTPDEVEPLLVTAMELLAGLGHDAAVALQRFAEAWDRGEISPGALLPEPGRIGSHLIEGMARLRPELLGFMTYGSLRPVLAAYFAECRPHLTSGLWALGICPFCGAPPGFADVIEDGRRRLACHLCGGGWIFPRLRCPFCGNQVPKDLVRLQPDQTEEGYAIEACLKCRAYLKELDRRVRWNGGSALVEDWGSPHLDLIGRRAGFWRAVPTLIEVGGPE